MNPFEPLGPQLPQPPAVPLDLVALLQGGLQGGQPVQGAQPQQLPLPLQPDVQRQDPGLPLTPQALLLRDLSGIPGGTHIAQKLSELQKERDLDNRILKGMIAAGQGPETLTKGQVARTALANWARGGLMGPNFRSVQEEEAERKNRDLLTQKAIMDAKLANDRAQQQELLTLAANMSLNQHRQQQEAIAKQKADEAERFNRAKMSAKEVDQDLQKFNLQTQAGRAAAYEAYTKAAAQGLVHPNDAEQARILAGFADKDWKDLNSEELSAVSEKRKWLENLRPKSVAAATQVNLSPEAVDLAAQLYARTGQMPALGMGPSAANARGAILNRAPEFVEPGSDIASNKAEYRGASGNLANLQRTTGMILAFENTAGKNLDLALKLGSQVDARTQSPMWNQIQNAIRNKAWGDPALQAFTNAVQTASIEYAKVVTGQTGGQGVTDAARKETEKMLNAAFNPAQFEAAVAQMKADMANRRAGLLEEIETSRKALAPKQGSRKPPAPPRATPGTVLPGNISLADIDAELARRKGKK